MGLGIEDPQLRYFLNIIIANLAGLIKNLDFKELILERDLNKLEEDETLELEI